MPLTSSQKKILHEADSLLEIGARKPNLEQKLKYDRAAKTLLTVNAVLSITLIWRSFDSHGIPLLAKISLVFFSLGTLAAVLGFVADFATIVMSGKPEHDKACAFYKKNRHFLKKHSPGRYEEWDLLVKLDDKFKIRFKSANTVHNGLIFMAYAFMELAFMLISSALLLIGLVLLLLSAF